MKITKGQLKKIIREEVARVTTEQKDFDDLERHEAETENAPSDLESRVQALEDMVYGSGAQGGLQDRIVSLEHHKKVTSGHGRDVQNP